MMLSVMLGEKKLPFVLRALVLSVFVSGLFADSIFATGKTDIKDNKIIVSADKATKANAAWTIVVYIQSDNDLYYYSTYNINDMQKVGSTSNVNIIVQWDQPRNNKTWRYKILKGGRIDVGSLSQEMGLNPGQEIVSCMQWVKNNYPADRYMLDLWNHGSGIEDLARLGLSSLEQGVMYGMMRGILYDYSENTYLNNQALASSMAQVKTILGRNLDVLGMDACLMAMVEIAYQVRDSVNYLVGSENFEPVEGWNYSGFLSPLVASPVTTTPAILAQNIVSSYATFYTGKVSDYTQSAIDVTKINSIATSLDQVVLLLNQCKSNQRQKTIDMIRYARQSSSKFYYDVYIDLDMFYGALLVKTRTYLLDRKLALSYKKSLISLNTQIGLARSILRGAIIANRVGNAYSKAKGLSIYYPTHSIDASYPLTNFAQNTNWYTFLQNNL
ncbi:MAG: clostripain-related cysteine peptidase [bacterium]